MEYRAGMFVYASAFLLGVVFVQQLAELPTMNQMLGIVCGYAVIVFFAAFFLKQYLFKQYLLRQPFLRQYQFFFNKYIALIVTCISLFIIGISYSSFYANQRLSHQFNENFIGRNLLLTGSVSGIPVDDGKVQRFEFYVDKLSVIDSNNDVDGKSGQRLTTSPPLPKKIRLSWYYGTSTINAGDKWQLEVRLKPPHGFLNPGGFDYEGWLFQHGIQATGYVRQSALNQKQGIMSDESLSELLLSRLSRLRQKLGDRIDAVGHQIVELQIVDGKSESLALIKALAIGDKSAISKQQWQVLRATGTSHLMAISGLHIGLAAWFSYVLFRRIVPVAVIKTIPAQHVALVGSVFIATLYALVAGFSVPTQRAFIMLFILSMMVLIRRNHRPVDALGFALIMVVLLDPLAVLSAGFWFSFSAVAVIFISLSSYSSESDKQPETKQGTSHAIRQEINEAKYSFLPIVLKTAFVLKKWVRLQLLISLFLLPLSLYMFQQVSLISPVANLLLIPYVSFLVVPLVLLALCLTFILPELAAYLFYIAAGLLDLVWPVLTYFSAQPYALWVQGDVGIIELLLATSGLCLIYFSKSLINVFVVKNHAEYVGKKPYLFVLIVSSVLLLPLLWPIFHGDASPLSSGEYTVTLLDVGQGSAAVVKTQNHVVVFDTGAKFSKKLDAGSSVVVPFLRSQAIRSIDRLIISHGDADHIGGATAVLEAYPETAVLGQDISELKTSNKKFCVIGNKWQWDGVDFELLSPMASNQHPVSTVKRNNKSCVLKVSSPMGSTLFTGDIEKAVEQQLLADSEAKLKSDVLIIPHHGSKTSSSQDFINAVNSKIAILSVGYKNRYKLPNQQVISRYQASGSEIIRTDKDGAITIQFTKNKIQAEKYREREKRYWHHSME